MKKFLSRKFVVTAVALIALVAIGIAWASQRMTDVGLWGLWFAAINAVIGIYGVNNVAAKKAGPPSGTDT